MDKMKTISSKVAKGVFLAIGIPYGMAIVANVISGWPCSQQGEGRYKRALQPARVLKITYALAEHASLVRWIPVFARWTAHYKNADNLSKDVPYGRNNNTLDVWTPEPIRKEDVSDLQSPFRPVIVFVYGGAWGSGDKNMYGLLSQQIVDHLGAVVIVPNYSIYPKGNVRDMVNDLHDTLAYIQSAEFHRLAPEADQNKVILFGHSAGAHLCALSTIHLVESLEHHHAAAKSDDASCDVAENESRLTDQLLEQDSVSLSEATANSDSMDQTATETVTVSVAADYKDDTYSASDLLSSIRGVVGLGGVYHIMEHYHHEAWRGVEDLSPMWRAMVDLDHFDEFSPTERILRLSPEQIKRLPPFYLIHGTHDSTVPSSSTEKFTSALSSQDGKVTLRLIAAGGHADLIIDMMQSGRKFYDTMINLLMEMSDQLLK